MFFYAVLCVRFHNKIYIRTEQIQMVGYDLFGFESLAASSRSVQDLMQLEDSLTILSTVIGLYLRLVTAKNERMLRRPLKCSRCGYQVRAARSPQATKV